MSCRDLSFLCVNGTLVVQFINFAIFFAVLNVVFLRPVATAIAKRREYINGPRLGLRSLPSRGAQLARRGGGDSRSPRGEKPSIACRARARASNEAAEMASRYAQQAQSIIEAAQKTAQAELEAARAGESDAVRGIAGLMLERVDSRGGAMSDAQLYFQIAVWSQIVSSIFFIGVLVFMWFRWLLPVFMAAQERSNRQIARSRTASGRGKGCARGAARGNRERAPRCGAHRAARERARRARASAAT